jgi:hypothetical protein
MPDVIFSLLQREGHGFAADRDVLEEFAQLDLPEFIFNFWLSR